MTYNQAIAVLDQVDSAIHTADFDTAEMLIHTIRNVDCSSYEQFVLDSMVDDMRNRIATLKWRARLYEAQ
jgi:hypothetical protein